ncbi:hypothetical protein [Opitutus sp. ER46]|uniref:hypothetical protein n=1 Tax=Opitutus sp. ER46 TaxID=2161864 RepID=UPI000D30BC48|nr:hypothetical protein [Opitutus sp. ER46]PTX92606.1 hypothetical protein DB354_14870 [Opitutus sp. ER46]
MLALAYSFLLFAFWVLVGRAVIAVVFPRLGVLLSWLLSPALGLSVLLLGLMVFNQLGLRLGIVVTPLTLGLAGVSLAILFQRRPIVPWRQIAPFALAVVAALLWAGWPALLTGFDWVSYANDDMANYCLAAQRFLDRGFYEAPTMAELAGRDYSSYYFFMHVADMMRFGAEHLVAWSAALGHVKATQGFMPAIMALALVQLASAGALVLHLGRWRRQAAVAVWVLAGSPLFMLGALYQLIAQVGGVALLIATIALLLRPWATPRRRVMIQYAILPAITASALCIFYPEVTPFAGLVFVGFALIWSLRNRAWPSALLGLAAYTLLGVVILLRHNLISYVSILVVQFNGAMDASNLLLSLFPYFMLPTGFSNFLGWMPIAHDFPEPVVSLSIAAGMLVVALVLLRALRDSWRLAPAALLLLIQFAFAARLFSGANDFGLYKLAMWMQPALAACLAAWIVSLTGRRVVAAGAIVALYLVSAAPTGLYYTQASCGVNAGGLTELRLASRLGLTIPPPADHNAQLTSTIENVVAAKFAGTELRGYPLALVSRDFFWPTTRTDFKDPTWSVRLHPYFEEMSRAAPLITERNRDLITNGVLWGTQLTQPVVNQATASYVSIEPQLSLFNKFHFPTAIGDRDGLFVVEPAATVKNRLLFVHSGLGNHYYLGDRRKISFFQQEPDLYEVSQNFNAIGRFLLLRIENPSPKVYLRIAATRTFITGHTAWDPRAVVHGREDIPLDGLGDGAFNRFVGPLAPQVFEGANYLAIDFKEFPRYIKDRRPGLKRLYNEMVPLDYRRLIGWARDISAIGEDEYLALERPREISNFPRDFAMARGLEFSGMFEDGWISAHATFVIGGAKSGEMVRLRGVVPQIKGSKVGTGTVKISINGQPVGELTAALGSFDWLLPIPNPRSTTAIDLRFSVSGILEAPDERPVSALLEYLGVVAPSATLESDFTHIGAPRLAAPGIDPDGWMLPQAGLMIPAAAQPREILLTFEYPDWGGAKPAHLQAILDGTTPVAPLALVPGTRPELRLRVPASASPVRLQLEATSELTLPAPDSRRRALRLLRATVAPAAKS